MDNTKAFNVRLPTDIWIRLKHFAADNGTTMNKYIVKYLDKTLPKSNKTLKTNKKR